MIIFPSLKYNNKQTNKLTTVLGDVHVHTQLWNSAAGEVCHTAVGGQVSELHVYDLQTAGSRGHVRVAAQQYQVVRVVDERTVLVPGVVDLVLRGGIHVAGQLKVATHLDGFTVLVGVRCDLEGQVVHRCEDAEPKGLKTGNNLTNTTLHTNKGGWCCFFFVRTNNTENVLL